MRVRQRRGKLETDDFPVHDRYCMHDHQRTEPATGRFTDFVRSYGPNPIKSVDDVTMSPA